MPRSPGKCTRSNTSPSGVDVDRVSTRSPTVSSWWTSRRFAASAVSHVSTASGRSLSGRPLVSRQERHHTVSEPAVNIQLQPHAEFMQRHHRPSWPTISYVAESFDGNSDRTVRSSLTYPSAAPHVPQVCPPNGTRCPQQSQRKTRISMGRCLWAADQAARRSGERDTRTVRKSDSAIFGSVDVPSARTHERRIITRRDEPRRAVCATAVSGDDDPRPLSTER
jgi:hypothetical protein